MYDIWKNGNAIANLENKGRVKNENSSRYTTSKPFGKESNIFMWYIRTTSVVLLDTNIYKHSQNHKTDHMALIHSYEYYDMIERFQ